MKENKLKNETQHRKNSNTRLVIFIGALVILVLCLGGYFIYNEFINKNDSQSVNNRQLENNNQIQNDAISTKDFSYNNYKLNLISKIKEPNKIYAIDLNVNNKENNTDIYVRYTNENKIKIATVYTNEDVIFEYRTLSVDNNKLYFIIKSREGELFELYYIDFNDLSSGAVSVSDFNEIFINDNLWESGVPAKKDVYSSKIFVNDNDIYYTSFTEKTLKTYNMETKEEKTILDNIDWFSYIVDTTNNKIFYLKNYKLYLSDLDGNGSVELDNIYTGSDLWTDAIYDGSPLFEETVTLKLDDYSDVNLYTFDYTTKTFKKVKENIAGNYTVKYKEIVVNSSSEKNPDSFVKSFSVR